MSVRTLISKLVSLFRDSSSREDVTGTIPSVDSSARPYPEALRHYYDQKSVRDPIDLYRGQFDIKVGTTEYKIDGEITLAWLPSPRVVWSGASDNVDPFVDQDGSLRYVDPIFLPKFDRLPLAPSGTTSPSVKSDDWNFQGSGRVGSTQIPEAYQGEMASATFLIANLPRVVGAGWIRSGTHTFAGRTSINADVWQMKIDAVADIEAIERGLYESGGHAITHVGSIERVDGSKFGVDTLVNVLSALRYSLSLGAGRWVSPCLPVGYAADDSAVWSRWDTPLVTPWRHTNGVSDPFHRDHMGDLFTGLLDAWDDSLKREILTRAIYYLMDANDPTPVEIAVSSAQAGLELLAWAELVQDAKLYSERDYKSRTAADNFRELLNRKNIPVAIPADHPHLLSVGVVLAANGGFVGGDGPELLTRMRNCVMHPSSSKPRFSTDQWVDAWRLSRHYLQLAILAFVGYNGTHCDPLVVERHASQVESVPWVV